MLRGVRYLAPALVLLILAGCGGSGTPPEEQVRSAVAEFARATAAKDYPALCDRILAPDLIEDVESIGLPCERALEPGLGDVRDPRLSIGRSASARDAATARSRTSAAGQQPSEDTLESSTWTGRGRSPLWEPEREAEMADEQISDRIEALVKEEHQLLDRGGTEHGLDSTGHARLEEIRVELTATGTCCASGVRAGRRGRTPRARARGTTTRWSTTSNERAAAEVRARAGGPFAVVMYGGVSLAIYINGVAQELFRLVRATAPAGLRRSEMLARDHPGLPRRWLGGPARPGDYARWASSGGEAPGAGHPTPHALRRRHPLGDSAGGINGVLMASASPTSRTSGSPDLWLTWRHRRPAAGRRSSTACPRHAGDSDRSSTATACTARPASRWRHAKTRPNQPGRPLGRPSPSSSTSP